MNFISQVGKNPLIYIALVVIVLYAYTKLFRSEGEMPVPRKKMMAMKKPTKKMMDMKNMMDMKKMMDMKPTNKMMLKPTNKMMNMKPKKKVMLKPAFSQERAMLKGMKNKTHTMPDGSIMDGAAHGMNINESVGTASLL